MIEKKGDFNFGKLKKDLKRFRRVMPKKVAETSKNHFLEGFRKGGGQTDKSRSGWISRDVDRNPQKYSPRQIARSQGRAILVRTGAMRGDILARQKNYRQVVVNTIHVRYAGYHNKGVGKLPQREFIGKSRILEKKNRRIIEMELSKIGL